MQPMVTLEELQRSAAQVRESGNKIFCHRLHKYMISMDRRKLLLEESHKNYQIATSRVRDPANVKKTNTPVR